MTELDNYCLSVMAQVAAYHNTAALVLVGHTESANGQQESGYIALRQASKLHPLAGMPCCRPFALELVSGKRPELGRFEQRPSASLSQLPFLCTVHLIEDCHRSDFLTVQYSKAPMELIH